MNINFQKYLEQKNKVIINESLENEKAIVSIYSIFDSGFQEWIEEDDDSWLKSYGSLRFSRATKNEEKIEVTCDSNKKATELYKTLVNAMKEEGSLENYITRISITSDFYFNNKRSK